MNKGFCFWNTFCFPGFPKPRVYWFKDGHPLRSSERILLQAERDVHGLEILEVKREDMGEYSAYISNVAGSAYSSARLIVLSMYANTPNSCLCKKSIFHISLIFIVNMFKEKVKFILEQVQGRLCRKIKEVFWYLPYNVLQTLSSFVLLYIRSDYVFVLHHIFTDPKEPLVPPRFLERFSNRKVKQGTSITLSVKVEGLCTSLCIV